ncbi:hypothetical protein Tco_1139521 [Tanacetum coccineum]
MADSWKAMDLNRFVVKDDMIDYVLHKYGSNWQVIIIKSDTSYDYFSAQTTSDEGSDHNPFQATFDESFDHNPFQVASDESSDDTLKSSTEDTCSSDCLVVPTKRPPPVTNCILGLAAVTTWQRIMNKEFGIISSKQDVRGSSNVRSKGKRKMM